MEGQRRFKVVDWEAEFREFLEAVPALPTGLSDALAAVPASVEPPLTYRPCEVELDDGTLLDAVYVMEARSYYSIWGVAPWKDSGKRYVPIERVRSLHSSPTRLPPDLANKLYEGEEDGMGYRVFELVLADGRHLSCQTGNAVDFITLPEGVRSDAVVDVRPGVRGSGTPTCQGRRYAWSLFQDETTRPGDPLYPR